MKARWVISLLFLTVPRMRILAAIHPPAMVQKILACLGLPPRPSPVAPALPDCEMDELYLS